MAALLARRPRAVVFDMDGLMLDTEPLAARAWSERAIALGVTFDAALALRMVGRNFTDCTALVRGHYEAPYPIDELLAGWHATYDAIVVRDGLATKAGVHELLDWLDHAALPRAVATSTRRARAHDKLTQAGLIGRIDVLVGGDEVARGKPAPDLPLEAARRLAVAPADCIVLEDSEPGVRAALAAGMTVFMVPDLVAPTAELIDAGAIVAQSLHDVRAALERATA
jgi:beta-phosphoglucomutase-like phosphatase (HAD superfamily)